MVFNRFFKVFYVFEILKLLSILIDKARDVYNEIALIK